MKTQICTTCQVEKNLDEFHFRNDTKKYRTKCKTCTRTDREQYQKTYKQSDKYKKYSAQYYINNKPKIQQRTKQYYEDHIDYYRQYSIDWYITHKKEHNACTSDYYQKNKSTIHARYLFRIRNDPNFRLLANMRRRINHAIKGNSKSQRTLELLGCSPVELKAHIEKQFTEGMSWENYGKGGWDIDHIMPCVIFDLSDPVEQKQCFHYTNLQPLWHKENISKGCKSIHSSTK